jgi:uncharacterized membrane protein YeaQ/YmgE (transglycosylase-associated protein family)
MSLIVAIIVGALAGYAAQYIMKTEAPYGLIGDIVLGIIGGIVGDAVLGLVGLTGFGLIGSFIVAVIGAVIFIYVLRMIK